MVEPELDGPTVVVVVLVAEVEVDSGGSELLTGDGGAGVEDDRRPVLASAWAFSTEVNSSSNDVPGTDWAAEGVCIV